MTLLKRFVSKSSSQAIGDYVVKINTYIKLGNIESFLEVAPIEDKLRDVDEDNLDPQAKAALEAFRDALERREKGIEDDW